MTDKISKRTRGSRSPDARVVKVRTEGKRFGIVKTLAAGLIILGQLALLLLIYLGLLNSFKWYMVVAALLSFLCCLHVISGIKTGQSRAVWVLFLMVFSSFGYIFYILSSEDVFFYHSKRRYKKIFARTAEFNGDNVAAKNLAPAVQKDAEFLWRTGNFKVYENSRLKYYSSGTQMFDAVISALENAEKFIFIEFFIISDGVLLNSITEILCRKVKAGVEVRIICDGLGSHRTLSFKTRKKLRKAGVKLLFFNRIMPHFTFALNLRDHRKIIVVDGKVAFSGGCNLADEYVNAKRMHGYWKDAGIKTEGDAVDGITLLFLRQWEFLARKQEDYSHYFGFYDKFEKGGAVVPYADGKDYKASIGKGVYDNIISGARERLYIMTPYFVPDETTFNMMYSQALSGVDVRLVLCGVPDKAYVYLVTLDNAQRLVKSGVKVYIMRHAFVHSKVMLSENCAAVSSVNIDLRSYFNQFENGVYTDDEGVKKDILSDFENTFNACDLLEESKRKNPFKRFVSGLLRLFAPLM